MISDHNQKEDLIWESFKQRLGVLEYEGMLFNLNELMTTCPDLAELEADFTKEEIDGVISQLTGDKSPGPDGFNNEFIKACLLIIVNDFYNLIGSF